MMSPCYKVLVKKIAGAKITLQVNYFELKDGFDVQNHNYILRLLAFGTYFYDARGNFQKFNFPDFGKQIEHKNLYDFEWLAAHAHNFYQSATCLNEWEYLKYLYLEHLPDDIYSDPHDTDFAHKRAFFDRVDFPHCLVEIEVADKKFISHLSENMFFEVY